MVYQSILLFVVPWSLGQIAQVSAAGMFFVLPVNCSHWVSCSYNVKQSVKGGVGGHSCWSWPGGYFYFM